MPSPYELKLMKQFKPIDERVIRVSIEFQSTVVTFENLAITVKGTKFSNALRGDCEVTITNIEKTKADYILSQVTPFEVARRVTTTGTLDRKQIVVEVGRQSTGTTVLYRGDIFYASITEKPDTALVIQAKTGLAQAGNVVSSSYADNTSVSSIASQVASVLGLTLNFEATDKQVSNYSSTGPALNEVNKLEETGDYSVFIDNQVLNVTDKNATLRGKTRLLDANNGLIGIPKGTERGVKVTMLWDAQTVIGGLLRLTSTQYPAVNGRYKIYKLSYDLSNRDIPFYYVAECQRLQV